MFITAALLSFAIGTVMGAVASAATVLVTKADKKKQKRYEQYREESMDPDIVPDIVICYPDMDQESSDSEYSNNIREKEEMYKDALRDADKNKVSHNEKEAFINGFIKSNKSKYGPDWKRKNIYMSVVYDFITNKYSTLSKDNGSYRVFFNASKAGENGEILKTLYEDDSKYMFSHNEEFDYFEFLNQYTISDDELWKRYGKRNKRSA